MRLCQKKQRSSNFELLRIIAMLMIVAFHIYYHCMSGQLSDAETVKELGNYWYCTPKFYPRLSILALIAPLGLAANGIFIMISGYFMADKPSINLTKISKKLLLQLAFAAIVLAASSSALYWNDQNSNLVLTNFTFFNTGSWFIGYYFVIILIGNFFLNRHIAKLNQKQYLCLILILFCVSQFSFTIDLLTNVSKVDKGFETVCIGIFYYCLGGYLKRFNPFRRIRTAVVLAFILFVFLITVANFYMSTINNINNFDPDAGKKFFQSIPKYKDYEIVPVLLAISLFELFRRMEFSSSRAINFIASSTFMIYLLHDTPLFYSIYNTVDWITILHENLPQFFGTYFLWVIAVFCIGFLTFCIYLTICKLFRIAKPLLLKQEN